MSLWKDNWDQRFKCGYIDNGDKPCMVPQDIHAVSRVSIKWNKYQQKRLRMAANTKPKPIFSLYDKLSEDEDNNDNSIKHKTNDNQNNNDGNENDEDYDL